MVTTTSEQYADCFGFSEEEVFGALDEYDLPERKQEVKAWYDGFIFGSKTDIYNPWSIINYLNNKRLGTYWVNSSSNSLIGKLVREGSSEIKMVMESLLNGETMNDISCELFSSFDTEKNPSGKAQPERFHFVEATTKVLKEPNP